MRSTAQSVLARCDELAAITDEPGQITRWFHSPAMQQANALVGDWMREAGLEVRVDAAFNLIGRWPSSNPKAKTFVLGSHLDTVRHAGKYDGPLGVIAALACVANLKCEGGSLPFHLEVVGFSDEEGLRYQTTYLGSQAMAGTLRPADLARVDEKGIEEARRAKSEFLGYAELHIEQGPVLESKGLATAAVSAIAGQSRIAVELTGHAGHAGTTPMKLRQDALCAAAPIIAAAEKCGVLATVGQLAVEPGASNVIPSRVVLSLDVRHALDLQRLEACARLKAVAEAESKKRGVKLRWQIIQQTKSVPCAPELTALMRKAVALHQTRALELPSGAGHDAAAFAKLCPVTMLFVRCKGGLSHHPDESVAAGDVGVALTVLRDFLMLLKERHE